MKILIFSDLHLHNWNYGSTIVDGMNDRLRDQARVLDQIALYCEWNEVDHIVFCGDLFHTHGKVDAAVLKVAYEGVENILAKSNVYIDFLVGNHDTADKSMNTHALHWLSAFGETVRVIDRVEHDFEMDISFLNYTEDPEVIKKFFRMAQPLCFMHQGVAGVPMGSGFVINEILNADAIPDYVTNVFTGHYHRHTAVNNQLTIVGSAMQLTWADEGDRRGFLVYDTDSGKYEHIESVAPKFVTLDMDNGPRQLTIAPMVQGHFVRVKHYGDTNQEEIRKDLTGAGARSVEFVVEKPKVERLQPIQSDKLHLPEIVEEYERQNNVSPELSKVGKELMK